MKKVLTLVLALGLAMPFLAACAHDEDHANVALCGSCGQMKGSDVCCAEGATACEGCKLAKGSPGCCKMAKGEDAALCTGCGHIKGAEACCTEGAERCGCGMIKGSPGCCKMPKK